MSNTNSVKKKTLHKKEILEFFYAIEDRFHEDESKIREFIEIINQENNLK